MLNAQMPVIVCLCGSTRFMDMFHLVAARETLNNKIVVAPACVTTSAGQEIAPDVKQRLDELHKRKIDLADEVFIVNVGGYVGSSTKSEIAYAQAHSKPIRWLVAPEKQETQIVAENRTLHTTVQVTRGVQNTGNSRSVARREDGAR